MVFQEEFFKKVDFEKKFSRRQKSTKNFPGGEELTLPITTVMFDSKKNHSLTEGSFVREINVRSCTDPENFVRGGTNLITFFFNIYFFF